MRHLQNRGCQRSGVRTASKSFFLRLRHVIFFEVAKFIYDLQKYFLAARGRTCPFRMPSEAAEFISNLNLFEPPGPIRDPLGRVLMIHSLTFMN